MTKDKMKEPLIQKYTTQSLSKPQKFLHFHTPELVPEHKDSINTEMVVRSQEREVQVWIEGFDNP
jgi:hypothetical protein